MPNDNNDSFDDADQILADDIDTSAADVTAEGDDDDADMAEFADNFKAIMGGEVPTDDEADDDDVSGARPTDANADEAQADASPATSEDETDDEIPEELPGAKGDQGANWKRLREAHKAEQARVRELEARLAEREQAGASTGGQEAGAGVNLGSMLPDHARDYLRTQQQLAADVKNSGYSDPREALQHLARMNAGDVELNEQAAMKAYQYLTAQSPKVLTQIMQSAAIGQFGEHSDYVRTVAHQAATAAQAREIEAQQSQQAMNSWNAHRTAAIQQVQQVFPDLEQAGSASAKAFMDAHREVAQVLGDTGVGLYSDSPLLVMRLAQGRLATARVDQLSSALAAAEKERDELRERLAAVNGPVGSRGKPRGSATKAGSDAGDDELKAIEQKMVDMLAMAGR